MGKLASVLAAAAGVAAFGYLTGPAPERPTVNASSHPMSTAAVRRDQPRTFSAPPASRTALAREIETELQRLGCYAGPNNGAWNDDARQAMQAVTERAAVRLPVQQPDYILLTLARRLPAPACPAPCAGSTGCTTAAATPQRPTAALIPSSGVMAQQSLPPPAAQRRSDPWQATVKDGGKKDSAQLVRAKREAEREALAARQRRLAAEQEGRSQEARNKLMFAEQQRQAELALLEARRRQDAEAQPRRSDLPAGRMGLGVVQLPGDTRDAPLPSVAMAPQPGIPAATPLTPIVPETARAADLPRADDAAKRTVKRQRDASVQPVARPPAVKRKAWTRTIFQDLSRNGP